MELFTMWENLPRIHCFAFSIAAIIFPKIRCQTNRNELTVQHQTNVDRANAFSSLPNSLHVRCAEKVFLLPLDIGATLLLPHIQPAGKKSHSYKPSYRINGAQRREWILN